MKTARIILVQTVVIVSLLTGLSNTALGRSSLSIGFGVGHPGFYSGHRSCFPPGPRHRRRYHYRERRWQYYPTYPRSVIVYRHWTDSKPVSYIVTQPTIIERTPMAIEKDTVVVQPKYDEETMALFEALRYRKSELLRTIEIGDNEHRLDAIVELAGFSFDDKVRNALEKVLFSDPDSELRQAAARSLGKVKNVKARAALEKARVQDPNVNVRKEADRSLDKIERS